MPLAPAEQILTWADFQTPSAIITFAAAIAGALAAGVATFLAEALKSRSERRRNEKADVAAMLIQVILITADYELLAHSISTALEENREKLATGHRLWHVLYKFDLQPALRTVDSRLWLAILQLRDRELMEQLLEFTSAYFSDLHRIDQFHRLRDEFEKHMVDRFYMENGQRFIRSETDVRRQTLEAQIDNCMEFLRGTVGRRTTQGHRLQKDIFKASRRYFGSSAFLRMPPHRQE